MKATLRREWRLVLVIALMLWVALDADWILLRIEAAGAALLMAFFLGSYYERYKETR